MSKVIHFKSKRIKGIPTLTTPCPYREGKFRVVSLKCKECVFHQRIDYESQMMICSFEDYEGSHIYPTDETKQKPIPKKPVKTNPFFGGEKK